MVGLSLLIIVVAYIFIARLIIKKIDNKKIKYIVLAVYILIPTWDIVPGKFTFHYLCYKEAGEKIFKTVDGVPGFLSLFGGSGSAVDAIKKYGYEYNEVKSSKYGFIRYSISSEGIIETSNFDGPLSKYSFYQEKYEYPFPWRIIRYDQFINNLVSKEILAIRTRFSYSGGWVSRYLGNIGGGSSTCPRHQMSYKDFFNNTLKPIRK